MPELRQSSGELRRQTEKERRRWQHRGFQRPHSPPAVFLTPSLLRVSPLSVDATTRIGFVFNQVNPAMPGMRFSRGQPVARARVIDLYLYYHPLRLPRSETPAQ